MKFSKLVSGISSLAIASSMFAGLAVTASAADTEVDFIGSSSKAETFDEYAFTSTEGTWSSTADLTTNFSTTIFTAGSPGNGYGVFDSSVTGRPVDEITTTTTTDESTGEETTTYNYPIFLDGDSIAIKGRGKTTQTLTYAANDAVTSGVVTFNTGLMTAHSGGTWRGADVIKLMDSSGKAVLTVNVPGKSTGTPSVTTNGGSSKNTGTGYQVRNAGQYSGFKFNITVDLDNNTASCVVTGSQTTARKVGSTELSDLSITDGSDIASMVITTSNSASSEDHAVAIDNTQFYAMVPEATTHSEAYTFDTTASDLAAGNKTLTVKFKNSAGTIGDDVLTETLTSETVFSGQGDAAIAVIITDIAEGYSVASATIE